MNSLIKIPGRNFIVDSNRTYFNGETTNNIDYTNENYNNHFDRKIIICKKDIANSSSEFDIEDNTSTTRKPKRYLIHKKFKI
jgi:hypothetical protein